MAWLESHQSLRDHPKKDRLAELLFNGSVPDDVSDYAAAGLLHYLWYWALDYAQDGDLSKFSDRQLAKGCRWTGDPALLFAALRESGFVEKKTRRLHDWDEYAGRLLHKREQDRERKREWRERGASNGRDADAPRDGARTNQPTNLNSARTRARKGKEPVDNSVPKKPACPKCETELVFEDGVGRCPVCAWREAS